MHDTDSRKLRSNRISQDILMDDSSRQDNQCPQVQDVLNEVKS